MLLLDPLLQDLPWEGVKSFAQTFDTNVCRDFSVHVLGHRISSLVPPPPATGAPAGKGAAAASDGSVANVSSSVVRVLADPFGDDNGNVSKGCERPSMQTVMSKLVAGGPAGATGAAKWIPVTSNKASVTVQDWIGVTGAFVPTPPPVDAKGKAAAAPAGDPNAGKLSAVLTYVPGKLACFLPVCELAALNLETVGLMMIADQGHSANSILRQNAMDNLKAKKELYLETPNRIAALATLAGVGSIIENCWATSLASQSKYVETFWNKLTTAPQTTALAALCATKKCTYDVDYAANAAQTAVGGVTARSARMSVASSRATEVNENMKLWIKCSRIMIGVPNIGYVDL
jgi:hypothetical protein